jgi:G3E family GTPase
MAERLKRQVMISDTLIINKIDSGSQNLTDIHESLTALNPDAVQLESSYCQIQFEKLRDLITGDALAISKVQQHNQIKPQRRAKINTVVLKTTFTITRTRLDLFLQEVESRVIRMKGFVNLAEGQTLRLQSAFGETHTEEIHHYTGPTEMIGIGFDITAADFGKKFHHYRKS